MRRFMGSLHDSRIAYGGLEPPHQRAADVSSADSFTASQSDRVIFRRDAGSTLRFMGRPLFISDYFMEK
jgi:hypothetical protein